MVQAGLPQGKVHRCSQLNWLTLQNYHTPQRQEHLQGLEARPHSSYKKKVIHCL